MDPETRQIERAKEWLELAEVQLARTGSVTFTRLAFEQIALGFRALELEIYRLIPYRAFYEHWKTDTQMEADPNATTVPDPDPAAGAEPVRGERLP